MRYFALYFKPKLVLNSLLSAVIGNLQNGILCFDIDNNCIYINSQMRDDIKLIQRRMLNWFHHKQEKICLELRQEKYLPDRLRSEILEAAREYLKEPDAADKNLEKMSF